MSRFNPLLTVLAATTLLCGCAEQQDQPRIPVENVEIASPEAEKPAPPAEEPAPALEEIALESAPAADEDLTPALPADEEAFPTIVDPPSAGNPGAGSAPVPPVAEENRPTSVRNAGTVGSGNAVAVGEVGSEAIVGAIASSTAIPIRTALNICTNTHRAGQEFVARTTEQVNGSFRAALPAGTQIVFQIVRMSRSDNVADPVVFELRPRHVELNGAQLPIEGVVENLAVESSRRNMARRTVAGGVAGAAAGYLGAKIAGESNEDAAKVAAGTGLTGAGLAAVTTNTEGCISAKRPFVVRLTRTLEMRAQ
jgi:hypothetical protein